MGKASVVGGLGSQGHRSQVDEMKQAPFAMGVALPVSIPLPQGLHGPPPSLRDRVQHYLPTLGRSPLVTGLLTWGHDLVALASWFWFPVGITCLLCETDGSGSQAPRLGTEAEH